MLSIAVWRDSVSNGDDCAAPHELSLVLEADATVRDLADRFLNTRYLPLISGDRATWILEGRQSLAVFAQQWSQPRFLVSPSTQLTMVIDLAAQPHLNFVYWCQVAPERVFECLQLGEALPNKFGG